MRDGVVLDAAGQAEPAAGRRYVQLYPYSDPVGVELAIGHAYACKKDYASAAAEMDKIIADYSFAKGWCAFAMFQKALAQKAMGDLAACKATLEQVIKTYPDQREATLAKAQLGLMK